MLAKYHLDVTGGGYESHERCRKIIEAYKILSNEKNHYKRVPKEDLNKLMVGFTATPKRGDKVKLSDIFQDVVFSRSIKQLVNREYLVKPEGLHVKVGIDLRKVRTERGDFKKLSLREAMTSNNARAIVTDTIKKFASNRKGIVFSVDIEHSEMLKEDIQKAGFSCDVVHSKISAEDRVSRLKGFVSGNLQFIVNPMILTEGFDFPPADCMINAAPTQNRSLYIQKAGRVLRPYPNKEKALLIDFGATSRRHTLRTAVDLMGEEIKMKTVQKADELSIKPPTPNLDLHTTEKKYDPLTNNDLISREELEKRIQASKREDEIQEKFEEWLRQPDSDKNQFDEDQYQTQRLNKQDREKEYWEEAIMDNRMFNPMHWPEERVRITDKQLAFLQNLSEWTHTEIPEERKLRNMGIGHAAKSIKYLMNKKAIKKERTKQEPITYKQAWLLKKLTEEGQLELSLEKIEHLSKFEASSIIHKYKTNKSVAQFSLGSS